MRLLDRLVVHFGSEQKYIELFHGDLTDIPPEHAVDVLVISAFPNDYWPTRTSLIGALDRKGLSVADLAKDKSADLRENFSCWLSQQIAPDDPGLRFNRILCFEPLVRGRPAEVIGDIFRSLMPVIFDDPPIRKIAMPLVATGNQGASPVEILTPLLDAAVHWLSLGMPTTHIKIVEHSEAKASELKGAFAVLKEKYIVTPADVGANRPPTAFDYDVFVSYSHEDTQAVTILMDQVERLSPQIRVFIDRKMLNVGMAWQHEIFEAIDNSRKVIAMYSPAYLSSKVCKEEFNIALFRHRHSDDGVLMPIYLHSAPLPTYMKLIQYVDCREGDIAKLQAACERLLTDLTL